MVKEKENSNDYILKISDFGISDLLQKGEECNSMYGISYNFASPE